MVAAMLSEQAQSLLSGFIDGVLSTARAHSAKTLTQAARIAVPSLATGIYGAKIWNTPAPRVFQALVGFRREMVPQLKRSLGSMLGELR